MNNGKLGDKIIYLRGCIGSLNAGARNYLYSVLALFTAGWVCMCVCVCTRVFPSVFSRSATLTLQIRNSNCKIIPSMETIFYSFALEALKIWMLPQTEWMKPQFSMVTNSGNGRFYLKGVQPIHKSSRVQIMEFSNWDKCAFKNFYFDHLFQVTLVDNIT